MRPDTSRSEGIRFISDLSAPFYNSAKKLTTEIVYVSVNQEGNLRLPSQECTDAQVNYPHHLTASAQPSAIGELSVSRTSSEE